MNERVEWGVLSERGAERPFMVGKREDMQRAVDASDGDFVLVNRLVGDWVTGNLGNLKPLNIQEAGHE